MVLVLVSVGGEGEGDRSADRANMAISMRGKHVHTVTASGKHGTNLIATWRRHAIPRRDTEHVWGSEGDSWQGELRSREDREGSDDRGHECCRWSVSPCDWIVSSGDVTARTEEIIIHYLHLRLLER